MIDRVRHSWLTPLTFCLLLCSGPEAQMLAQSGRDSGIALNVSRGVFGEPIQLSLRGQGDDQVFFTTDGTVPTPQTGQSFPEPLDVRTTTTLRFARFKDGERVGRTETHTYIFPQAVLRQTGAGLPASWGVTNNHAVAADYEMDPEIVNAAGNEALLETALRSLPSLSIVMRIEDLFDPVRGIYANPLESGIPWERTASAEWLSPYGQPGFQIDCGIRIQGGWNRRPEESPKHSFRLVFHKRYGTPRLRFPVFGESGVGEFETLILRAGCNNTWLHWNGEERRRGDYLRDQWMRDTLRDMGRVSARGCFVHLYLNGQYWGLYNVAERPSAPFAASNLGGSPKDYDSRNGANILEGTADAWTELFGVINGGVVDERSIEIVQALLDLPSFCDYILANIYGGNADWDRVSNWYAARRRRPPGPFQFFIWDAERTLESVNANILELDDDQSPMRLFQKLRHNPHFRGLFAERVRQHCSTGGALSPAAASARWLALVKAIEAAMIAESARWGDYRRDFHPYKAGPYELYTVDQHWRPEVNRLLKEYFPRRTDAVLEQLRADGLDP